MSKRVQTKIKEKHSNTFLFTNQKNFQVLLNSTIASCGYDDIKHTVNFLAYIKDENRYVLYSLKQEKYITTCTTIFILRPDTLKKYYKQKSFLLFKKSHKHMIESYIKLKPSDQTGIS